MGERRVVHLQGLGQGHGCPFCTTINMYKFALVGKCLASKETIISYNEELK